jgi:hypothetical protein
VHKVLSKWQYRSSTFQATGGTAGRYFLCCILKTMTAVDGLNQVSSIATNTALTAWSFASDFLIIIVLLGAFFMYAWYIGRGPFIAILLSFYSAYALYVVFPFSSYLPSAPALTALVAHVALYLAFTAIFFLILRRVVVSDFLYVGIFGVIALSFLGAAFILVLAYHVVPVAEVYTFTPPLDILFAPKEYFWWWFVAPAIGLFFLAR